MCLSEMKTENRSVHVRVKLRRNAERVLQQHCMALCRIAVLTLYIAMRNPLCLA